MSFNILETLPNIPTEWGPLWYLAVGAFLLMVSLGTTAIFYLVRTNERRMRETESRISQMITTAADKDKTIYIITKKHALILRKMAGSQTELAAQIDKNVRDITAANAAARALLKENSIMWRWVKVAISQLTTTPIQDSTEQSGNQPGN